MNSNWVFFLYQYIFKFTPPKSTPKNTWNLKSLEPPLEKGTHDHAITRNLSKYSISLTSMNPQDIFEDPSNNSSTHETFTKKHPAFLKTTQKISHRFFPSNQSRPFCQVKAQREQFASAEAEAKEKTQKAEAVWDGKGRLSCDEVIPDVRWWVVKVLNSWEICWLKGFDMIFGWFFKFASSNLWVKNLGWAIFPNNYGWSHCNFPKQKTKQNHRELDASNALPDSAWASLPFGGLQLQIEDFERRASEVRQNPTSERRRKTGGPSDSTGGKRQGEQNTWWRWLL